MKEELYNKIDKFCNETDWSKYPTYEHALEEFIKGIVAEETKELQEQNEKMLHTFIDLLWFEEHLDPYMYECNGAQKGELLKPFDNARLFLEKYKCKKCKGEGTIKVGYNGWTTNPCPACEGKGYVFRR